MAEVNKVGGSPYNLRKNAPSKGPSPRKPIRKNDKKENDNEIDFSGDEIDSSPQRKESTSPDARNISKLSEDGQSPPRKSPKTCSPVGSSQSDHGFSSNSSFERSPSPCKSKKAEHSTQEASKKSSSGERSFHSYAFIVLAIVMVLFGIYSNCHFFNNTDNIRGNLTPEGNTKISFDHFQRRFKDLKMKFPGQERIFWRTIFGLLRPMIVETNPAAPAVFMMVVPKNQDGESRTAECLAKQLLTLYSGLFNRSHGSQGSHIHITRDLSHESPAVEKKELDNKLHYIFGQSQGKGVILDNFESLTPFAALLLHGFCDGDNAPYKDVLFIQVVYTDMKAEEITSQKNYMDKYLKELWISDLDEDKIQPLLTRIANNVAMVSPETEQTLQKNC
ncbi:torsin-1A-interacting protein 2-like [Ylistrum balloti]|uniref:torsin-1A-interacting protein 2-like n=1 Tax=Ylistrum balloti TaxID=509963 RepID=UPI002905843A|nr:torsin-1A-interacting protein 2-like [Ylistrum balloti]